MSSGRACRCGCGLVVPFTRRYVDKVHQLAHMRSGEARRMNALQPAEAKRRGGSTRGTQLAGSGQLAEWGRKGAARTRELAGQMRRSPGSPMRPIGSDG